MFFSKTIIIFSFPIIVHIGCRKTTVTINKVEIRMKDTLKKNYINSINLNQNTSFPYLVLDVIDDNAYPRNPGFQVMHWHEDLQFIYVLEGNIEVQKLDTSQRLQA